MIPKHCFLKLFIPLFAIIGCMASVHAMQNIQSDDPIAFVVEGFEAADFEEEQVLMDEGFNDLKGIIPKFKEAHLCTGDLDFFYIKKVRLNENAPENVPLVLCSTNAAGSVKIINWLSRQSPTIKNDVKCLVLMNICSRENLNAAVLQIFENSQNVKQKAATYLPFAQFWYPQITTCRILKDIANQHDHFLVTKSIKLAKDLPEKLPIVVIHNASDNSFPVNTAREFYNELCRTKHDNAYLLEVDNNDESAFLNPLRNLNTSIKDKISLELRSIYKKHGLPIREQFTSSNENSASLKPSIQEVQRRIFKSSILKQIVRTGIDLSSLAIVGYLLNKFCKNIAMKSRLITGLKYVAKLRASNAIYKLISGCTGCLLDNESFAGKSINYTATALAADVVYKLLRSK